MLKVSTAKVLWSLTTICFTGFTLQIIVCHGSTFSPVLSPLGDNVYITDTPTSSTLGVSLASCASQCMFYSALNGGSSICRCFNYNSSNANCSVFAFQPKTVNVTDLDGSPTAYQTSDGFVTALFPTVSRRQCLFPFEHNGQISYDCIYSNSPKSVGRFGCVLPNKKQAFCNPQSGRGLFLTKIIAGQSRVTAMTQFNDELYVLRSSVSAGVQSQVTVYNTTTFQEISLLLSIPTYVNFSGLAVDATINRVFLSDFNNHKIHALDLNTFQEMLGSSWSVPDSPNALSMNSVHNILVPFDNGDVYEYTSSGTQVTKIVSGNGHGVSQAVEVSNGNLVISSYSENDVRLIAINGTVLRSYGVGKVNNPGDLAVDKTGFVLVADRGNNRILALDPTLTYSSNVTFPLDTANEIVSPKSLWYDESRGRLYVGESGGQYRVLVFDNLLSISDVLQP